jgi:hypothetical protein
MLKILSENLTGPYIGVGAPQLLPAGAISDGKNVRRVSLLGGWEPRKGCTLKNTSAATQTTITSIHSFLHPVNGDFHLISHAGGYLLDSADDATPLLTESGEELLTEDGEVLLATLDSGPIAQTTSMGAVLDDIAGNDFEVGSGYGYSATLAGDFVFANGYLRPSIYGGDRPPPTGFLVYDDSAGVYTDYFTEVTNGDSAQYAATNLAQAADAYFICGKERLSGIELVLGANKNSQSVTLTIYAWRSGSWTTVGALTDNTSGTVTHDQSGSITWTGSSLDEMRVMENQMGYWYKVSFSAAVDAIDIVRTYTHRPIGRVTNKWNGLFDYVASVLYFTNSDSVYADVSGRVSNESESQYLEADSMGTSDYIYVKTSSPAAIFGFGVIPSHGNTNAANLSGAVWTGAAWTTLTITSDETKAGTATLANTGRVEINFSGVTPKMRTLGGDKLPGYWYRFAVSAALSADVQIYVALAGIAPEALESYAGCCAFGDRILLWGGSRYPNRIKYSDSGKSDQYGGLTENFTGAFGDGSTIKRVVPYNKYALVFKSRGVWVMDESFNISPITTQVGISSPASAVVFEVGTASMQRDQIVIVAAWQDTDGVYIFDGSGIRKISEPVDQYFNTRYADAISASYVSNLAGFIDPLNSEYHLVWPEKELVYNYSAEIWYPPWEREVPLSCGVAFKSTDSRYYTFGGTNSGFVLQLENDTTDKNTSNVDVAIDHYVDTRDISFPELVGMHFNLRDVWITVAGEATSTEILFDFYGGYAAVSDASISVDISDTNSSYTVKKIPLSRNNLTAARFRFRLNSADKELKLISIAYGIEARGEIPHG